MTNRYGSRFTVDHDQFRALVRSGVSVREAAARLGISHNWARSIVNGNAARKKIARRRGFSVREEKDEMGVTTVTSERIHRPCPPPHVLPGIPLSRLMAGR